MIKLKKMLNIGFNVKIRAIYFDFYFNYILYILKHRYYFVTVGNFLLLLQ